LLSVNPQSLKENISASVRAPMRSIFQVEAFWITEMSQDKGFEIKSGRLDKFGKNILLGSKLCPMALEVIPLLLVTKFNLFLFVKCL
jgi:hypothetical protein